eukprot:679949-Ditylum_brightwellii.AAC.1
MVAFLEQLGVEFNPATTAADLALKVKEHRGKPKYAMRKIAAKFGHEVLFTPPYHPELQPIKKIWAVIK